MRVKVEKYMFRAISADYEALLTTLERTALLHIKAEDGKRQFLMPRGDVVVRVSPQHGGGVLFDFEVARTTMFQPGYIRNLVRTYDPDRKPIAESSEDLGTLAARLAPAPIPGGL